jgi:hypothetical protein
MLLRGLLECRGFNRAACLRNWLPETFLSIQVERLEWADRIMNTSHLGLSRQSYKMRQ